MGTRYLCWAWMILATHCVAAERGEHVTIAERFTIESKVLKEERAYVVHKPWNYEQSKEAYPVLVLLDAETNIVQTAAVTDVLSNTARTMRMLVVGIENTDRQRDMTPPLLNERPSDVPAGAIEGAPQFLSFIADELLPHIDRTYRTRPTRILVGGSYAGLFTLYALFNRPDEFTAYIVGSPALWWDGGSMTQQAQMFLDKNKQIRKSLYMTTANEGGSMLAGALSVAGVLGSAPQVIDLKFEHWPQESHSSINMPTLYKGLEWLHQYYYTHNPIDAYERFGMGDVERRFAALSQYLGYEVKPPEALFAEIADYLSYMKRWSDARTLLEMQTRLYPTDATALMRLANACVELGDMGCARSNLERSVKLYPGNAVAANTAEKAGVAFDKLVPTRKLSDAVLRNHIGKYESPEGTIEVTSEKGKLFVRLKNEKHELRSTTELDFYAVGIDREYTFVRNLRGKTTSIVTHFSEQDVPGSQLAK